MLGWLWCLGLLFLTLFVWCCLIVLASGCVAGCCAVVWCFGYAFVVSLLLIHGCGWIGFAVCFVWVGGFA